jgi:PadR family transcriptional regulator, regulatory protein PadR
MQRNRPPSPQTVTLLFSLADDPTAWRHGYDLCGETGLKAGSLYPILMRLADRGWLEAKWETEVPAGRPPRHLYRLTATGRQQVRELARAQTAASRRTRSARLRPQGEGT